MKELILKLYKFIFLRKALYKLNLHIYKLSLRGIGILNSDGIEESGENYFFKTLRDNFKVNTILEVGANEGGYSIRLRKHFPYSEIHSFEPHPESFKKLKDLARNKNINVYNFGFSDKKGNTKLWGFKNKGIFGKNYTSPLSSVFKSVITDIHKKRAKAYKIKLKTLDDFAKNRKIGKIDLLLIDTEGSELNVLIGATKLLKKDKIKVILFEFNEMNVISRVFMRDFINLLSNFRFYRLLPDGMVELKNYSPKTHEIFAYQNIAAFNTELINNINNIID